MITRPDARLRVLVAAPLPADVGAVASALGAAGHEVVTAYRPEGALARIVADQPDAIIVDPALSPGTPAELVRRLRAYGDAPLLVLADLGAEEMIAAALDSGAVDVVLRPVRPLELLARVAQATRHRFAPGDDAGPLPDGLRVDIIGREATVAGRALALTPLEFDLLAAVAARRGAVVDHRLLVRAAWPGSATVDPDALRTHLSRLNGKLVEAGHPGLRNARSRGYALRIEGSGETGS